VPLPGRLTEIKEVVAEAEQARKPDVALRSDCDLTPSRCPGAMRWARPRVRLLGLVLMRPAPSTGGNASIDRVRPPGRSDPTLPLAVATVAAGTTQFYRNKETD
jgi:hypothetical protein